MSMKLLLIAVLFVWGVGGQPKSMGLYFKGKHQSNLFSCPIDVPYKIVLTRYFANCLFLCSQSAECLRFQFDSFWGVCGLYNFWVMYPIAFHLTFSCKNYDKDHCPNGFTFEPLSRTCWMAKAGSYSWSEAQGVCNSFDAHLAAPKNMAEQLAMEAYLMGKFELFGCLAGILTKNIWLGGVQVTAATSVSSLYWSPVPGEYEAISNFTHWELLPLPMFSWNKYCMTTSVFTFFWNVANCNDKKCAVCQADNLLE